MKKIISLIKPSELIKLKNQIILILISVFLVILLLIKPIQTFISTDPAPKIEPISQELGHTGYKVEAGMHIENFHEFDLTNNNFILNAILWFKFNPAVLSLDTIENFSFEKGDILYKSKPITKIVENKVLAQYRIKFRFTSNLDYRMFPLNSHRIFITLTNKKVSPKELVFEASESGLTLSENMLISGWKKVRHEVITGYSESLLDRNDPTTKIYHPVLLFVIDFMRSGLRQVYVLFITLLFIFYLSILSLSMGPDQYGRRIGTSMGIVTSFLYYRFIIERMAPKVGYLMFIDNVFHILLFLSFFIFFVSLATKDKEYKLVRGTVILLVHTIFIVSWFYLCYFWGFS